MKLLIATAIVFFGTLMAAALVALGIPGVVDLIGAHAAPIHVADSQPPPFMDVHAVEEPTAALDRR